MIAVMLRRTTKVVQSGVKTILWQEIILLAAIQAVCALGKHLVIETFQAKCMIGDHDIVLWNKDNYGCIDECRARAECETINVHASLRMCRMHMQDTGTLMPCDDETGFLFSEKKNWKQKTLPGCDDANCGPGQTCEVAYDENVALSCVFRECSPLQEPLIARSLGNDRFIGARVCFSRVAGYSRALRCLHCEKNGTWNCPPPQSVLYLISGPSGIPDSSLTSSSKWSPYQPDLFGPKWARLNKVDTVDGNGAWSAGSNNNQQWIQASFNIPEIVKGIAIQGRDFPTNEPQWVSEYTISYSIDCIHFQNVSDFGSTAKKFIGNHDTSTVVTNMLESSVTAVCVRLHPTMWHSHISLRWDIIGC